MAKKNNLGIAEAQFAGKLRIRAQSIREFWKRSGGSLLLAIALMIGIPLAKKHIPGVAELMQAIEIELRDTADTIRFILLRTKLNHSYPFPLQTIGFEEPDRVNISQTHSTDGASLPTAPDWPLVLKAMQNAKQSGASVISLDLLVPNAARFKEVLTAIDDEKGNMPPIVMAVSQSNRPSPGVVTAPIKNAAGKEPISEDSSTFVQSQSSNYCLGSDRLPYIDFPYSLEKLGSTTPDQSNIYFGHAELQSLSADQVMRGVCLFRTFMLNNKGDSNQILLPALSLMTFALRQGKNPPSSTDATVKPFDNVACVARKLGSLDGIKAQLKTGPKKVLTQALKDCSMNLDFVPAFSRPIWINFEVRKCAEGCQLSFAQVTGLESAEKSPISPGAAIMIGRKDLFATDRFYIPAGDPQFGVDIHAHIFSTIDRTMLLPTMVATETSSSSSIRSIRKFLYAILLATGLAFIWALRDYLLNLSKLRADHLNAKARAASPKESIKPKKPSQLLSFSLKFSAVFFAIGVGGLISVFAFGTEFFMVKSPQDDAAYAFVVVLVISFAIEFIVSISALIEKSFEHLMQITERVFAIAKGMLFGLIRSSKG
jgi:hypothetical protein